MSDLAAQGIAILETAGPADEATSVSAGRGDAPPVDDPNSPNQSRAE